MQQLTRRAALAAGAGLVLAAFQVAPSQAQIAIIERAMPALIIETQPPAPIGMAWVPGHWVWRFNRWVWARGHYVRGVAAPMPALLVETPPPSPGPRFFWVRGHYAWGPGGWRWNPGHWVR